MPPYLKFFCQNFHKKLFKKTPEGVAEPPHMLWGEGGLATQKWKGVGVVQPPLKKERDL